MIGLDEAEDREDRWATGEGAEPAVAVGVRIGYGGQCVEVGPLADDSGRVAVRHSHHPDGSVIVYTRAEWQAFLAGAKDGEFDFIA